MCNDRRVLSTGAASHAPVRLLIVAWWRHVASEILVNIG